MCLVAPGLEPGWRKAFFVCAGGIQAVRTLPPGGGAKLEVDVALSICREARETSGPLTPEQAEDLLLIDGFVRRPPPELLVLPLEDLS